MKVEVQPVSNVEVKVVAEIPTEVVEPAVQERLREIARTISVRGFRKGKAPQKLVEARLGAQVRAEVAQNLFEENLEQIFTEAKVIPIGEPEVEMGEIAPGEPLTISLGFEVMPEVSPKDYKSLEVPATDPAVDDEKLQAELEKLREKRAQFVPLGDDAVAETEVQVTLDYEGFKDGEPVEEIKGESLELIIGEGRFIPGFEDALRGAKVGESREFDLTFPEDYGFEKVAGQEIHFKVNVRELKQKQVPALDDELAVDEGHSDLEALKQATHERLLADARAEAERERNDALVRALIERNPMDLPPKALKAREEGLRSYYLSMWQSFGMNEEFIERMLAEQGSSFEEEAAKGMRKSALLDKIAEREEIEISDEDFDLALARMAEERGEPFAKTRAWAQQDGNDERLRAHLLRDRVMDKLIEWNCAPADAPEAPATESADEPATESAEE